MNSALHRIRSLRWQVGAGSTAQAFSWRALLHEKGTVLVLPVLEQVLDETASNEQVLHIPKIELNIRLDSYEELETLLAGKVLEQLREQLQGLRTTGGADEQAHQAEKSITTEHNHFEILLHYLKSGSLPWQATGTNASEQADVLSNTCRAEWPRLQDHLKAFQEEATFYFRLLQLLPEEEYDRLIRVMSEAIPQEFRAAAMQCLALLLDEKKERIRHSHYTRLNLMSGILAESIGRQKQSASRSLYKAAVAAVPGHERHLLKKFVAARPRPITPPLFQHAIDTVAWKVGSAPGTGTIELPGTQAHELPKQVQRKSTPPTRTAYKSLHPGGFSETDLISHDPGDLVQQSLSGPSAELFPLLVQQTGLVLLHPYLVRLFENCGVKEAGRAQLRKSALPHAASLLHFLATGREELYEYELCLTKILLGLQPDTPLPVCAGLLTSNDREEIEALLQSVISHWSALKNTSAQGVRSSFIERQGLLRLEDRGWKLNVERRPYDMLLEQIPWGFSIVKLPWMQQAIFTEW